MKSTRNLLGLFAVAFAALSQASQVSQAGTIFTSRADYDAAVAGLNLSWSEDFEGFAQGPVAVPTSIGGGSADIVRGEGGTAEIREFLLTLPPGGNNEWSGVEGGISNTICGPGSLGPGPGGDGCGLMAASLGVNAMGFDYHAEKDGFFNFHHSGGVDSDASMPLLTPLFVGWVGDPGEVLDFVDYTSSPSPCSSVDRNCSSHVFDDFVAHVVPEPATLLTTALGLFGLLGLGYRRTR